MRPCWAAVFFMTLWWTEQLLHSAICAFDVLHATYVYQPLSLCQLLPYFLFQSHHPRAKSVQVGWMIAAWMSVGRLQLIGQQAAFSWSGSLFERKMAASCTGKGWTDPVQRWSSQVVQQYIQQCKHAICKNVKQFICIDHLLIANNNIMQSQG